MFRRLKNIIVKMRDFYLIHIKWKRFTFGSNFHAGRNVEIWAKDTVVIGNNCYIGRNSQIECNITIGKDVLIGNNVAFIGRYDHNYQEIGKPIRFSSQIRDSDYTWKEINSITIVEDDVWIGYGSIILSGVTIQQGSIVGAGSVVTKNIEAYSIYAGSPAKKIANRFDNEEDTLLHKKIYSSSIKTKRLHD